MVAGETEVADEDLFKSNICYTFKFDGYLLIQLFALHRQTPNIQGINVCCNTALQSYTAGSRDKLHPSKNKSNIDNLSSCVSSVTETANVACGEEYSLMKECLTTNKRAWVKCQDLKKGLDLCLVKNKAGELGN